MPSQSSGSGAAPADEMLSHFISPVSSDWDISSGRSSFSYGGGGRPLSGSSVASPRRLPSTTDPDAAAELASISTASGIAPATPLSDFLLRKSSRLASAVDGSGGRASATYRVAPILEETRPPPARSGPVSPARQSFRSSVVPPIPTISLEPARSASRLAPIEGPFVAASPSTANVSSLRPPPLDDPAHRRSQLSPDDTNGVDSVANPRRLTFASLFPGRALGTELIRASRLTVAASELDVAAPTEGAGPTLPRRVAAWVAGAFHGPEILGRRTTVSSAEASADGTGSPSQQPHRPNPGHLIQPLERKYPRVPFLLEFKDPKKEREFERWYWKRNQRVWVRGVLFMLLGALVFYIEAITAGFVLPKVCSDVWDAFNGKTGYYAFIFIRTADPALLTRAIHVVSMALVSTNCCVNIVVSPTMLKMSSLASIASSTIIILAYLAAFRNYASISECAARTCLLIYALVGLHLALTFEKEERRAFTLNLSLVRNNDKLRHQLTYLSKSYKTRISNMGESPLEKAILTLKSVLANPNVDLAVYSQVDQVVEWLSASEKIFTPSFDRNPDDDDVSLNDEQEAWLLELIPSQTSRADRMRRRDADEPAEATVRVPTYKARPLSTTSSPRRVDPEPEDGPPPSDRNDSIVAYINGPSTGSLNHSQDSVILPGAADSDAPRDSAAAATATAAVGSATSLSSASTVSSSSTGYFPPAAFASGVSGVHSSTSETGPNRPDSPDGKRRMHALLANVNRWDWDIFEFESIAPKPLYALGLYLFHKAGLMHRFAIPLNKLRHFLARMEAGYHHDIPYHNSTHACDVLHATHCFVNSEALIGRLSDLQILAAYLAAIMHDYDHPGYNNQHMIATGSPKALLYNDRSVLENYHVSSAWHVLTKDDCNILSGLPRDDARAVRDQCIDMVLATDLTSHFSTLSAFKNKVFAAGTFDLLNNSDDRALFWRVLIKCADVSNMARPWNIYWRWCGRIMTEFFRQGDEEKRLGLPVSPFMDRDTVLVPTVQLSFCDYICTP
ncbi:hypothetical protein HK405_013226, partial [Cladochytrium tenue]